MQVREYGGGVLVPVAQASDAPLMLIGVGEGVEDLQPFDARAFSRSLVGLDRNAAMEALPEELRQAITLRVEGFDLQVVDHLALTSQAPALGTLVGRQCLGLTIQRLTGYAAHQTGVTTAGAAAVRHRYTASEQRIEQVGLLGDLQLLGAHTQLRHPRSPSWHRNDYVRRAWPGTAPDRHAAGLHRDRHRRPAASCRRTG